MIESGSNEQAPVIGDDLWSAEQCGDERSLPVSEAHHRPPNLDILDHYAIGATVVPSAATVQSFLKFLRCRFFPYEVRH